MKKSRQMFKSTKKWKKNYECCFPSTHTKKFPFLFISSLPYFGPRSSIFFIFIFLFLFWLFLVSGSWGGGECLMTTKDWMVLRGEWWSGEKQREKRSLKSQCQSRPFLFTIWLFIDISMFHFSFSFPTISFLDVMQTN